MKRSELKGFSAVFKFTFTQAIRAKSFIVTMIVMIIFAFGMSPVMALINKGDSDKETKIEKVYLDPQVKEYIPFNEAVKDDERFGKISFEDYSAINNTEYKDFEEKIKGDKENAVILRYNHNAEAGYELEFSFLSSSKVSEAEVNDLSGLITDWLNDYKIENLGVSDEVMKKITKPIKVGEIDAAEYIDNKAPNIISNSQYQIVYALLMVSYFIILMAANMVSAKIVEEKTNRIVEYLMTTVRPMALLFGKIAAMLLVTVGELSLMLGAALLGKAVAKGVFDYETTDGLSSIFSEEVVKMLTPGRIMICILIIGLGILIYGIISGLFAATVSKMDELQQGMRVFQTVIIVSFLVSVFILIKWMAGGVGETVMNVVLLIPFTSVFLLPGSILIGKASAVLVIAALAIQVLVSIFFLWFVSLVYESIIVMNGEPVSLKQMIQIAKGNFKSTGRKEADGK